MPPVLFCLAVFVTTAGFYLLLAGSVSTNELISAGALAVALAVLASILRLREERGIALALPPPRFLVKPLAALFTDTGRIGLVLMRALLHRPAGACGSLSTQPFRAGAGAKDRGRRALVMLASSLAPNGYALDQAPGEEGLQMHRLAPASPDADAMWPT